MATTTTAVKIGLVVLVCLAPATAVAEQNHQTNTVVTTTQQANYTVSVSIPGEVTTGEQTLAVTVDNTGSTDLLNPIIEVPLDGRLNATATDADTAVAAVDGTNQSINAEINASTITGGDALYMFGRQVPAGEQRTYYVSVDVTEPGSVDLGAEVRPLYNEDITASDATTVQATGYGNLTVEVRQPDGSSVTDPSITVGDVSYSNGQTHELPGGNYTISVADISGIAPTVRNVSLDVQEDKVMTFTVRDSVVDPAVTATTADASVITPSIGQTDTVPTAEQNAESQSQYTVETDTGTSVVSEAVPTDLRPLKDVEVTSESGQVVAVNQSNGIINHTLSATSNTDITVTFTGFKLGDANLDDTVSDGDAQSVASKLASQNASGTPQYADVNNDGNVTAVDAMYIAQYANGKRNAEYQMEGGT